MTDLFDPAWELPDLDWEDLGPYVPPRLSDEEKRAVWSAYEAGRPTRVPVFVDTNNRIALLDHRIPTGDLTYRQVFAEADAMLRASLLHKYVCRKRHHHLCDSDTDLPEAWQVDIMFQNVFEAWFFGCTPVYPEGEVPDVAPILTDDTKRMIFDVDIDRPLERPPFSTAVAFYEELTEYVADKTFLGRPIEIVPPCFNTDGPVTNAMSIRGHAILTDMLDDPAYANDLFAFLIEAGIKRRRAFLERFEITDRPPWFADDSIALIGESLYRELVMPHHRRWYEETGSASGERMIHLCGDATRYFPLLKDELGITSFDTGFPVDFTWLRDVLGPAVEVRGGVEVGLLLNGSCEQVYARARDILQSGIMEGGRFILKEANNLPPNVPWENLAAMYKAAFDFGRYA